MAEFQVDKGKMAKNTIALYMRMAFTMVVSFISVRVTLAQLGVEDYGLNNLVGSIVSMLSFIQVSMGTSIQRFYCVEIGKGKNGRLKDVFGVAFFVQILIAVIAALLMEIFAIFFLHRMNILPERMFAAQTVFQISIASMILTVVTSPFSAFVRAKELFDKMAILDVIQAVLRLGVLYLLVHINYDKLITLSLLNLAISILYIFNVVRLAWRFPETHSRPKYIKDVVNKMIAFVATLTLTMLASLGKRQGLVILINLFFGLVINAAYAVAVQVSNFVDNFVVNFKQSMVPQLMSSYGAGDTKTMNKIINTGTKISILLMLLITIPFIFEAHNILSLWLGTPPQYAAELVVLVLININISTLTYFHYQGIQATGKIAKNQSFLTILYIASFGLYYVVFKLGADFYSAMYVNIVTSCFIVGNGLRFAHKLYGYNIGYFIINIVLRMLFVIAISLLLVYPVVCFVEETYWRILLTLIVSTVAVSASSYAFLFSKDETHAIVNIVKGILSRSKK